MTPRTPRTIVIAAAAIALIASGCSTSSSQGIGKSGSRTLTIALGGPFSGSEKPTGDQIRAGAKLAAKQVNDGGGITAGPHKGAKIAFKEFDDADDPAKAATAIRTIVSDKSLVAFVGSGLSDASIAAAPVASRAGFAYLSAYASSEKILAAATGKKSVFVVPPTFPAYAFSVLNQLLADGHRRPAILHLQGTYGDGIAGLTVKGLADQGVTPTANESFTFTDTDLRTQLAKIKASNPDSLVMVGLANSDALIVKQANDLGLVVPFYDNGGITNSHTFLKDAGALAEGVVGNTPDAPTLGAKGRALHSAYQAVTGEALLPDPAAFAYEGVLAVAAAFAEGAEGRDDLAAHLHKISIDDTGVGSLRFADDGSRTGGRLYVYRITDGKPKFLTGYEQTGPMEVKEVGLS
ncbi:MAG: ABC transporter substrate-binding protein [Actinomycetota bacterium]|nr:ABC transporter substrate-binding protein [Actinomycetota bacterium]